MGTKPKAKRNFLMSSDIVLDEENGVTFQNYAISTFFKRRMSKQCMNKSTIKKDKYENLKQRHRVINFEDVKVANQSKCAIHLNHNCLLSGFIRSLAAKMTTQSVPFAIIKIIKMFYH